ncbi:hypothetical protein GCM10020227_25430 [Streptomyces flavovirens]
MHETYGFATPTADLVDTVMELSRLTEEAGAAIVVRQRSQGEPPSNIAPALELTVDWLRKKYVPEVVDQALASRRRPRRAIAATRPPDNVPTAKEPAAPPAPASGVYSDLDASPGRGHPADLGRAHESRPVLRIASALRRARNLLAACQGHRRLLRRQPGSDQALLEAGAGVEPTSTDPARYLRTYLQALRYANGSPSDRAIIASSQHAITIADLHQALKDWGVPEWPVVNQFLPFGQHLVQRNIALPAVRLYSARLWAFCSTSEHLPCGESMGFLVTANGCENSGKKILQSFRTHRGF